MPDDLTALPPAPQAQSSVPVYQPMPQPDAWIVTANPESPRGSLPKGFWKRIGAITGVLVVLAIVGRTVYQAVSSVKTAVGTIEDRSREMTAMLDEQDRPSAGFGIAGKVEASYENPFDEEASYTNPFDDYENPFVDD